MVCPAGFMSLDKVQTAIATLQQWGFKVKVGKTVGSGSQNYFSGSDDERLNDLQQMMDDKNIKTIMCARGGYGMGRIIDDLNFKKFKKNPKWIIGFSDITVLHSHLYTNYKIASLHAPMAAAFNDRCQATTSGQTPYVESLHKALIGEEANYDCATHSFNKHGKAAGRLITDSELPIINSKLLITNSQLPLTDSLCRKLPCLEPVPIHLLRDTKQS